MRIAIIDDEQVIRSGVAAMIHRIRPEWIVEDIYSDASEALSLCNWDKVQVALVDIHMPGDNGLSLVSELRQQGYEDVQVVFITAYASFDYAQQAAHLNMLDYLLKPVSRADLENVLLRAETRWKRQEAARLNEDYIQENLHTLRKSFLGELLFEEEQISAEEMDRALKEYHLEKTLCVAALIQAEENRAELKRRIAHCIHNGEWFLFGQPISYQLLLLNTEEKTLLQIGEAIQKEFDVVTLTGVVHPTEELGRAFSQLLPRQAPSQRFLPDPLAEQVLPPTIKAAQQYIAENYARRLTLKTIAEAVYLHPTYLSNVFKKQTGCAVVDYINDCRIRRAEELLLDPRNRIYWIVEQTGFSSTRYFSQVFKKTTGKTPVQYRQELLVGGK